MKTFFGNEFRTKICDRRSFVLLFDLSELFGKEAERELRG